MSYGFVVYILSMFCLATHTKLLADKSAEKSGKFILDEIKSATCSVNPRFFICTFAMSMFFCNTNIGENFGMAKSWVNFFVSAVWPLWIFNSLQNQGTPQVASILCFSRKKTDISCTL